MILTGHEIQNQVQAGKITITPFNPTHITTNSYDLCLGDKLVRYTSPVLDPKQPSAYEVIEMTPEGHTMQKGDFLLATTAEIVGSDHFVPLLHGKSGMARKGLFAHITADLIDLGYTGRLTLQLYATLPVKIYPGMKIAQVTFWQPKGEVTLYHGQAPQGDLPRVD